MKNILLVNELGAGSNHLEKLLYVSNLLKREKCKVYFAMPRIELQTEKIFSQDHKFFVTPMLDPSLAGFITIGKFICEWSK